MSDADHVRYAADGQVATVTLDRPEKLNALAVESWSALRDALERADGDGDVRAVVLGGAGRAFCAGADVGEFAFETVGDARAYARHVLACGLTVERIETPVVAKVDGLAHGGGFELAAICDVTVATPEASFRLPESLVGAVPAIAMVRFPALVGLKRTRELALTNRELSADEAADLGFVSEVVGREEVDAVARERAEHLATTAPTSTRLIKRGLNARLGDESGAVNAMALALATEEATERRAAFRSGRDPGREE